MTAGEEEKVENVDNVAPSAPHEPHELTTPTLITFESILFLHCHIVIDRYLYLRLPTLIGNSRYQRKMEMRVLGLFLSCSNLILRFWASLTYLGSQKKNGKVYPSVQLLFRSSFMYYQNSEMSTR